MPPWGAIKGFGEFRNDGSLTDEQMEMITNWVEGGVPEGEAKDLPATLEIPEAAGESTITAGGAARADGAINVTGEMTLKQSLMLDGILPDKIPDHSSVQVVAEIPGQRVLPLLWLYEYQSKFPHSFLYRNPLELPSGTKIHGVPAGSRIQLLPLKTK
jgi:hypothetical protein